MPCLISNNVAARALHLCSRPSKVLVLARELPQRLDILHAEQHCCRRSRRLVIAIDSCLITFAPINRLPEPKCTIWMLETERNSAAIRCRKSRAQSIACSMLWRSFDICNAFVQLIIVLSKRNLHNSLAEANEKRFAASEKPRGDVKYRESQAF